MLDINYSCSDVNTFNRLFKVVPCIVSLIALKDVERLSSFSLLCVQHLPWVPEIRRKDSCTDTIEPFVLAASLESWSTLSMVECSHNA